MVQDKLREFINKHTFRAGEKTVSNNRVVDDSYKHDPSITCHDISQGEAVMLVLGMAL